MKKILFSALAIFIVQMISAQVPEIEWTSTYGGSGSEGGGEMIENTDGDYFFACTSTSSPSEQRTAPKKGYRDIWVVKTKPDGTKVWDKSFGSGDITLTAMVATSDGGFIAGGNTPSAGIGYDKTDTARGKMDIWIIKVDRNGTKVWDKTLGGNLDDGLSVIIETPTKEILVIGSSRSPISGDKKSTFIGGAGDAWVIKLNSNGQYLWDKSYGGSEGESFYAGFVDEDGNYLFGGTSFSPVSGDKTEPSRGGNDGWLLKTDANGNKIWDKTLGGNGTDFIQCMAKARDGESVLGIVSESGISGDKTVINKGASDCWLVKLNKSSDIIWQKTIGGSGGDELRSLNIDMNDGIYIGCLSVSDISGDKTCPFVGPSQDSWIVKTNPTGEIEWQSCYEFAALYAAIVTSENDYVLQANRNSMYIIKLNVSQETTLKNYIFSNEIEIYPNPASNYLYLQLKNEDFNGKTECQILKIDGILVQKTFLNSTNGQYQLEIDLPNGIYLVKMFVGNKIFSQKLFVVKN